MILVDTSIWIDFFAGNRSVVNRMSELIDADAAVTTLPIRLELKVGVSAKDEKRLFTYFDALRTFDPALEDWHMTEHWIVTARGKGQVFSLVDLLIGATAKRNNLRIWSNDSDFRRMEQLGFVTLFRL